MDLSRQSHRDLMTMAKLRPSVRLQFNPYSPLQPPPSVSCSAHTHSLQDHDQDQGIGVIPPMVAHCEDISSSNARNEEGGEQVKNVRSHPSISEFPVLMQPRTCARTDLHT